MNDVVALTREEQEQILRALTGSLKVMQTLLADLHDDQRFSPEVVSAREAISLLKERLGEVA